MKKILIVDDNMDILNTLHLGLCSALNDSKILTAANGEKGLAILQQTCVDLILTDLDMPVMNGYRFIEQVRREHPHVSVFVMSGDLPPDVAEQLRSLGVKKIIKKPFLFDVLAELIAEEMKRIPLDSMGECAAGF